MCRGKQHSDCTHLDKLAQVETKPTIPIEDDFKLGKNTLVTDKEKLLKRAPRKYISRGLSLAMINYIKSIRLETDLPEAELDIYINSFWNMFRCVDTLKKKDGKITSKYCKNRLCMVCNSIRQAKQINKFHPVISEWKNARFVTVTGGPTVAKEQLSGRLDFMQQVDKGIRKMIQKKFSRGKCEKFTAIKKIECTFSFSNFGFHPHYHYIFKSPEIAKTYVSEWLKRTAILGTYEGAQKNIPCDSNTVLELTKYFTKVSTTVETKTGDKVINPRKLIYLDSLFYQFIAFRNKRTFTSYNIKFQPEPAEAVIVDDAEIIEVQEGLEGGPPTDYYTWAMNDWYSIKTGLGASDYIVDNRTRNIVNSIRKNYSIYD